MIEVTLQEADGFIGFFLDATGYLAFTHYGRRVSMVKEYLHDEGLINHELGHVEDYERYGKWGYRWRYVKELFKRGHEKSKYEQ
jgi:hypothetical protein